MSFSKFHTGQTILSYWKQIKTSGYVPPAVVSKPTGFTEASGETTLGGAEFTKYFYQEGTAVAVSRWRGWYLGLKRIVTTQITPKLNAATNSKHILDQTTGPRYML